VGIAAVAHCDTMQTPNRDDDGRRFAIPVWTIGIPSTSREPQFVSSDWTVAFSHLAGAIESNLRKIGVPNCKGHDSAMIESGLKPGN
jgi:hypothetical protein